MSEAAVPPALAVAGLLRLLRRDALTPARMSLFALFYIAFAIGIAILWLSGHLT